MRYSLDSSVARRVRAWEQGSPGREVQAEHETLTLSVTVNDTILNFEQIFFEQVRQEEKVGSLRRVRDRRRNTIESFDDIYRNLSLSSTQIFDNCKSETEEESSDDEDDNDKTIKSEERTACDLETNSELVETGVEAINSENDKENSILKDDSEEISCLKEGTEEINCLKEDTKEVSCLKKDDYSATLFKRKSLNDIRNKLNRNAGLSLVGTPKAPKPSYSCDKCGRVFKFMTNLKEHLQAKQGCSVAQEARKARGPRRHSCGKNHN